MALGSSRPRNSNKEMWLTKIGILLLDQGNTLDEAQAEMARMRRWNLDEVKAEHSRLYRERAGSVTK